MQISEQELRGMIREAIARHAVHADDGPACAPGRAAPVAAPSPSPRVHGSHLMFALESTSDGACIIEPSVACNHCGYCKSMGH